MTDLFSASLLARSESKGPAPARSISFPSRLLRNAAALILANLLQLTAAAQPLGEELRDAGNCSAEKQVRFRGGTLRIENDLFVNTDNNYTSGVAITAVSRDIEGELQPECLPLPVRLHAQLIKTMNPGFWSDAGNPAYAQNVVAKFGQSMCTPEDRYRTDLIADDRPYAGLLYAGLS